MKSFFHWIGIVFFFVFILLTFEYFDQSEFLTLGTQLLKHPIWIVWMFTGYFLAFVLRAFAWKMYLSHSVPYSRYLHALFYSLLLNHLLPIKAGDVVRVGFLAKDQKVSLDESVHSVLVLRILDIGVLGLFTVLGALRFGFNVSTDYFFLSIVVFFFLVLLLIRWSKQKGFHRLNKHIDLVRNSFSGRKGLSIVALVMLSWILESIVVYGLTKALGITLPISKAIWVNSFTISGQVFHFTPGGIGNYESMMSFSLVSSGIALNTAYHIAVLSHLFKFIFSYIVGIYVWIRDPISIGNIKNWIALKGVRAK